jgi:mRNA-degrading endonuclease toxin of MazEF toxin-antitoxin module
MLGWARESVFSVSRLQWNVYIARVSFVESEDQKLRPVIVMSEPVGDYKIVVVAPIYSVKPTRSLIGDIDIKADQLAMGLIRESTIRLHRMVSLPLDDFEQHLGQAPPSVQADIKAGLQGLFSL